MRNKNFSYLKGYYNALQFAMSEIENILCPGGIEEVNRANEFVEQFKISAIGMIRKVEDKYDTET